MRPLNIFSFAVYAAVLGLPTLLAQQPDPYADVTTSKAYEVPGWGRLENLGACKATADSIDCWNADGKPDPDLSEKVKAFYIIQNYNDLHFKFGRKNRLIVFKRPSNNPSTVSFSGPTLEVPNSYLNQSGQINGRDNESSIEWYPVDTAPDKKTISVVFTLDRPLLPKPVTVPLKEGTTADIGSLKVRMGEIKLQAKQPQNINYNYGQVDQKIWQVGMEVTGFDGPKQPTLAAYPVDKDGQVISRVDKNGNPMAPPKGQPNGFTPSQLTAQSYVQMLTPGHQTLTTNVNPTKVANLMISATTHRKVTFTDIPLDPN